MCERNSITYAYNVGVFRFTAYKFIADKTANDIAWHLHLLGSMRYFVEDE